MFKIGDILKTELSTETGYVKIVGINVDRNPFVEESNWDLIVVEFDPKIDSAFGADIRIHYKDIENAVKAKIHELGGPIAISDESLLVEIPYSIICRSIKSGGVGIGIPPLHSLKDSLIFATYKSRFLSNSSGPSSSIAAAISLHLHFFSFG